LYKLCSQGFFKLKLKVSITDIQTGSQEFITLSGSLLTIGRDEQNDLVIPKSIISRSHARLIKEKKEWFIEDCGSSNGTYIEKEGRFEKIKSKQKISESTVIRLSNCKILRVVQNKGSEKNKGQLSSDISANSPSSKKKWGLGLTGLTQMVAKSTTKLFTLAEEDPEDLSMMIPIESLKKKAAIIVLDQCNSSGIADANEQVAYHLKKRLHALTEKVLSDHPGSYNEGTGDGFLGIYEDPKEALQVAIKISKLINKRNISTKNPNLHFRLALHYGKVYSLGKGIHGNDINITFRIEGISSDGFLNPKRNLPKVDRIICSGDFLDYFKKQEKLPTVNLF
jgi:pSer/pThr/pTyr-binding forkhead associated (FHA) protein